MGIGINKMQINSMVICINFIYNSIHVCSLRAQPPQHIVDSERHICHLQDSLSTKINMYATHLLIYHSYTLYM